MQSVITRNERKQLMNNFYLPGRILHIDLTGSAKVCPERLLSLYSYVKF